MKDVERTIDGLPEASRARSSLVTNHISDIRTTFPTFTLISILQADLQASTDSLHKTFTKLLIYSPSTTPSSSLPKPGRPARQMIARALIKLHDRIESKNLFDLVQELLRVVVDNGGNVMKGGADGTYRV